MSLTLESAQRIAEQMIAEHLGIRWSFRFDHAKRRAGACHFTTHEISISRYFAAQANTEEFTQVMLHEIAHALAGPRSGHGPEWRRQAQALGYTGERTLSTQFAKDQAPWVGSCPGGHEHVRYRRPSRVLSCSRCAPRFDRRYVIEWSYVQPAPTRG